MNLFEWYSFKHRLENVTKEEIFILTISFYYFSLNDFTDNEANLRNKNNKGSSFYLI